MIEFGFALNAVLGINRASQAGALVAGQAGNDSTADCQILARIEANLTVPIDKRDVQNVKIMRTNNTGLQTLATNTYTRSGSKNCGTYTVPYTASSTGYPESQRCNMSDGCPLLTPPRSTVDKVAVQITYRHTPVTPLASVLRMFGGDGTLGFAWTFSKRNVSRMEPVI